MMALPDTFPSNRCVGTSVVAMVTQPNPGGNWHAVGTSNFRGDGNADILWQGSDDTPGMWRSMSVFPNPRTQWHL